MGEHAIPKVAIVSSSISRSAGGVATAVSGIAKNLNPHRVEAFVAAGHDKASDLETELWQGVDISLHNVLGPRSFGFQPGLISYLAARKPECVHVHGLWMYPSIACSQLKVPRVITPHGMLDPWALSNSALRKRAAMAFYEWSNLKGCSCIHALCEAERNQVRLLGLKVPVALIPNGINLRMADYVGKPPAWLRALPVDAKILLFLGRIHPKKGLVSLLKGFAASTCSKTDEWHIVVAGWDQGGHEDMLKLLTEDLAISDRVHFVGPQYNDAKLATLAAADAFVLPSQSEGIPIAVLEAWAFSLPVLITEQCNLPDGFELFAAIRIGLDPLSVAAGINILTSMSTDELTQMGANGRKLVEKKFNWAAIGREMEDLYRWLSLEDSQTPDCVEL